MRSRRRGPSKPCPCGGTCSCHHGKEKLFPLVFPIAFPLLIPGLFPGLFILMASLAPPPPVRYIQVRGERCVIHYKTDSCTSTGACSGHDEAICPSDSK
jgi:hypothetical protein